MVRCRIKEARGRLSLPGETHRARPLTKEGRVIQNHTTLHEALESRGLEKRKYASSVSKNRKREMNLSVVII